MKIIVKCLFLLVFIILGFSSKVHNQVNTQKETSVKADTLNLTALKNSLHLPDKKLCDNLSVFKNHSLVLDKLIKEKKSYSKKDSLKYLYTIRWKNLKFLL